MNLTTQELSALMHLGYTFLVYEKYEEAKKIFSGLTTLAPREAYPWAGLGTVAKHEGNLERACEYMEHAFRLDEGVVQTRLSLASLFLEQGRRQEARALILALQGKEVEGDTRYVMLKRVLGVS